MSLPNNLQAPGFSYELPNQSLSLNSSSSANRNHDLVKLIKNLEKTTNLMFGSSEKPLCLTVEQGLDILTNNNEEDIHAIVLNIGLNDEAVEKLADITDSFSVYQCYRLFIETFACTVLDISCQDLCSVAKDIGLDTTKSLHDAGKVKELIQAYRKHLLSLGHDIPQDPWGQLSLVEQKFSQKFTKDIVSLKVSAVLITSLHQPAITIDSSSKYFVAYEHVFDQNPALQQLAPNSGTSTVKLDTFISSLNHEIMQENTDDVLISVETSESQEESRATWVTKVKNNINLFGTKRNITIAISCILLVIAASLLLFFLLRSSSPSLVSLELYIYDAANDEPVSIPRVKLINQDLIVEADEQGRVLFSDLSPGDIELLLMHSDYLDLSITVQLTHSKTESVAMSRHGFTFGNGTIFSYNTSAGLHVIIPPSVNGDVITVIGESAFFDKRILSVVFSDTIQIIEAEAFKQNNIASVTLSTNLVHIGEGAFQMNDIETLVIPGGVTFIPARAFMENALSSIVIPDNVVSLEHQAFLTTS
ncbi:hypothetical protein GEMRC1_001369 [Eukaryota sp. GEM-RC1]